MNSVYGMNLVDYEIGKFKLPDPGFPIPLVIIIIITLEMAIRLNTSVS